MRRNSSGSRRCTQARITQPTRPVIGSAMIIDAIAPTVRVDRPRFLHVAQPQLVDFGRNALEPLQAVRPGQGVKAGEDDARQRARAPAASSSRRPQAAKAHKAGAAEQRIRQPHRRQGVADRRPVRVGREDEERERGRSAERDRISRAAGRARRQSATQNSAIADTHDREVDDHLEPDRERQRGRDAERQPAAHPLRIGDAGHAEREQSAAASRDGRSARA